MKFWVLSLFVFVKAHSDIRGALRWLTAGRASVKKLKFMCRMQLTPLLFNRFYKINTLQQYNRFLHGHPQVLLM
jgi:phosphotransferase system  glucose/maltose/N-acetylglucosamine-specific IIC component